MRYLFAGVGAAAVAAGAALYLGSRQDPAPTLPSITPAALYAATFRDGQGAMQPLGRFQDKLLVLNFWATWCTPCREEMPAFSAVQRRWGERGVQFLGLSNEDPAAVERFGRALGVGYPLWTGGEAVDALARRLGNRLGVLPFTVIVDRGGEVLETRIGPFTEADLEKRLSAYSANIR